MPTQRRASCGACWRRRAVWDSGNSAALASGGALVDGARGRVLELDDVGLLAGAELAGRGAAEVAGGGRDVGVVAPDRDGDVVQPDASVVGGIVGDHGDAAGG